MVHAIACNKHQLHVPNDAQSLIRALSLTHTLACAHIHIHTVTHSLTHSLTHSFTHSTCACSSQDVSIQTRSCRFLSAPNRPANRLPSAPPPMTRTCSGASDRATPLLLVSATLPENAARGAGRWHVSRHDLVGACTRARAQKTADDGGMHMRIGVLALW